MPPKREKIAEKCTFIFEIALDVMSGLQNHDVLRLKPNRSLEHEQTWDKFGLHMPMRKYALSALSVQF